MEKTEGGEGDVKEQMKESKKESFGSALLSAVWDHFTLLIAGGILIYLWFLSSSPSLEMKGIITALLIPIVRNSEAINWIKKDIGKISGIEKDISGIEKRITGIEKDIEWLKKKLE